MCRCVCCCSNTKEEDKRCVQVCMLLFIYQRGGEEACAEQDFREICLTSVAYRAMYSIVHNRLVHMVKVKQLVAEEQGGFRKGRGCSV